MTSPVKPGTCSGDGNFRDSAGSVSVQVLSPASLSGMVFQAFNDDGAIDFDELRIAGVTLTLTGTDDLGQTVNRSQVTDENGIYLFDNLRPAP